MEPLALAAPELGRDLPWLNTERPLALDDLRGRVALLLFFSSSCDESAIALRALAALGRRRARDPVVVVGVHAPRFDGERGAAWVEGAARRLGVRHPVVVDDDLALWRAFGLDRWPSMAVVRPDASLGAVERGAPTDARLDELVDAELRRARCRGELTEVALEHLVDVPHAGGPLGWPTAVAIGPGGVVAVGDAALGHVLLFGRDGSLIASFGASPGPSHRADAPKVCPSGLVFSPRGALFVADLATHRVVKIDAARGVTTVVVGTGVAGSVPLAADPARASATALRAPRGIALEGDDTLFVALAGTHQIARVDLRRGEVRAVAGSGARGLRDGPAAAARFAAPSGVALAAGRLFVADADNSAVRALDLARGEVTTVVGAGPDHFGLEDGPRSRALFQRCVDVVVLEHDTHLAVVDGLNGAVRRVDASSGATTTLPTPALLAPAAACTSSTGRALLVVDTGRHRLVEVPLNGGAARVPLLGPVPDGGTDARRWWWAAVDDTIELGWGRVALAVAPLASDGVAVGGDASIEITNRPDLVRARRERPAWAAGGVLAIELDVARVTRATEAELVVSFDVTASIARGAGRALVRLRARVVPPGEGRRRAIRVEVPLRHATRRS